MQQLTVKQCQYLKGLAHDLQVVVMVGNKGLTKAVIDEIEVNLAAHELIKIKVLGNDRELRATMIDEICAATAGAQFVQHLGKLLIIYRPAVKPQIVLPK